MNCKADNPDSIISRFYSRNRDTSGLPFCRAFRTSASVFLIRSAAVFLFSFAFTATTAQQKFPEPEIEWTEPDSAARSIFFPVYGDPVLLEPIPAKTPDGKPVLSVKAFQDGRRLYTKIEHRTDDEVFFTAAPVSGNAPVVVYSFPEEDSAAQEVPKVMRMPFLVSAKTLKGRDLPQIWNEYIVLAKNDRNIFSGRRFANSSSIADSVKNERRDRRDNVSVRATFWMNADKEEDIEFSVMAAGSVFLFADDKEILSKTFKRANDSSEDLKSLTGKAVIDKGLHKFTVVQVMYGYMEPDVRVFISKAQDSEKHEITPEMMIPGPEFQCRSIYERRAGILHPSIAMSVSQPFLITGGEDASNGVFASVNLLSAGTEWLESACSCSWKIADEDGAVIEEFNGECPDMTLPSGAYTVSLDVRNDLGFSETVSRKFKISEIPESQYLISGQMMNIPAVLDERDDITPELWFYGDLPQNSPIESEILIAHTNGTESVFRDKVFINDWNRTAAVKIQAASVAGIKWSLSVSGIKIDSGAMRFMKRPFDTVPSHASGTGLFDAKTGEALVLVVNALSTCDVPTVKFKPERIVSADDFIAPEGMYAGPSEESFTRILESRGFGVIRKINAMRHDPLGNEALSDLIPLTRLEITGDDSLSSNDLVIISIGLEAIAGRTPPEVFEKQLAAICGLYSDVAGAAVIPATFPPFNNDDARVRPYCEAVARVADSCGLKTADLYTAFSSASNRVELINGIEISSKGQILAADVIQRVISEIPDERTSDIDD